MLRSSILLACLLFACAPLGGCGDDDAGAGPATAPTATAAPAEFPAAGGGRSVERVTAGLPEGPIFAPSTSVMRVGDNRVGFVLFDVARRQVDAERVALYTARPGGSGVRGPYVAVRRSLAVKPPYRSAQTEADLAGGDDLWVATVPLPRRGQRQIFAVADVDGERVRTSSFTFPVGQRGGPPDVGDRAIAIRTLTPADVGGDYEQLSTRVPPPKQMLQEDFSEVLGRRPVVLQFATPALCQTRVCGPVVDIAEQVRAEEGGDVVFIQQEIYNDNDMSRGFRPQVGRWRLPTEPWIFVIDRDGIVVERFEGAFSADELAAAVRRVG